MRGDRAAGSQHGVAGGLPIRRDARPPIIPILRVRRLGIEQLGFLRARFATDVAALPSASTKRSVEVRRKGSPMRLFTS